jgi:hypothetical protein
MLQRSTSHFSETNTSCVVAHVMTEVATVAKQHSKGTFLDEKRVYYGDVRICLVCGLLKGRTDFTLVRENKGKCRACRLTKEQNMGGRHCECCGQNKPMIAFPRNRVTKGLNQCRPCMKQAVTVNEIV